jgi:hypothetical protein
VLSHVVSVTQGNRTHREAVGYVCITVCGNLLLEEWALIRGNQSAGQNFPCREVFKVSGTGARIVEVSEQRYPNFSSRVPSDQAEERVATSYSTSFLYLLTLGLLFRRVCT